MSKSTKSVVDKFVQLGFRNSLLRIIQSKKLGDGILVYINSYFCQFSSNSPFWSKSPPSKIGGVWAVGHLLHNSCITFFRAEFELIIYGACKLCRYQRSKT